MHVLLTNDDGIAAPGLLALENAVQQLGWQFTVVAPATEQSQCGHRVTTHQHLRVEALGKNRHAVHGTPADCVRLALFALEVKPDLVLSGVNAGGNLGQDIVISGTVAAAREAAYHGIRSMALSHYMIRELVLDWQRTAAWMAGKSTCKTIRTALSGTSICPTCLPTRRCCLHASRAIRHVRR